MSDQIQREMAQIYDLFLLDPMSNKLDATMNSQIRQGMTQVWLLVVEFIEE